MHLQVLLLAMFLSCILKKPDVDDDDLSGEDNHLKHDEEFLSRSERDIQGISDFACGIHSFRIAKYKTAKLSRTVGDKEYSTHCCIFVNSNAKQFISKLGQSMFVDTMLNFVLRRIKIVKVSRKQLL